MLAAGKRHGKACGLLVNDGAAAAKRIEQGWTFVAIGSDSTLLAAASRSALTTARATAIGDTSGQIMLDHQSPSQKENPSWLDTSTTRASPNWVSG